ncbi:MAG: non-ribosomal peptide synthetase, partial [Actinobacteria bacterium]|nr:non-ribosomal peptide synthetase [Actinomycetota bacterium]
QTRMWALDRIEGGTASYNMPVGLRLRGDLDIAALGEAFRDVILRHEPLRTVIVEEDGEAKGKLIPVPEGQALLQVEDLSALSVERQEGEIQDRVRREAGRLFDLSRDLMVHAALLKLGEDDHVLTVNIHHGSGDGISIHVFVRDLSEAYASRRQGRSPRYKALSVSYADHAAWQRRWLEESGELERQLEYWREALSGAPEFLTLPTDYIRQTDRSRQAGYISFELEEKTARALEGLAQRHGTTLFAVLMGIYGSLLGRLARQDDVVIGFPVAGRSVTEVQDLVGFFVNTLVLRLNLEGVLTGDDLIARAKQVALDALSHQEAPFERLVEDLTETRSLYHSSIFQASLAWQTQGGASLDLVDLEIEPIAVGLHESKFDVTLYLTPQTNGSISGLLEYDASLFAERTASSWICQFERLCEAFSSQSHAPLASLSLIDAHERTQVISTFNDTQKDIPTTTLPELFAAQVEKSPHAVALIFGEEEVSYRELDRRSNQLAHYLISQNIGP